MREASALRMDLLGVFARTSGLHHDIAGWNTLGEQHKGFPELGISVGGPFLLDHIPRFPSHGITWKSVGTSYERAPEM